MTQSFGWTWPYSLGLPCSPCWRWWIRPLAPLLLGGAQLLAPHPLGSFSHTSYSDTIRLRIELKATMFLSLCRLLNTIDFSRNADHQKTRHDLACRHQNASPTTWYEVHVLPCLYKSHVWVGDYVDHGIKTFASSRRHDIAYGHSFYELTGSYLHRIPSALPTLLHGTVKQMLFPTAAICSRAWRSISHLCRVPSVALRSPPDIQSLKVPHCFSWETSGLFLLFQPFLIPNCFSLVF